MPYIKQERRQPFDEIVKEFDKRLNNGSIKDITVGDLNYLISQICMSYMYIKGKSYDTLNGIHGVLNCSSEEIRRRITNKYEDSKISENGDCF